MDRAEEFIEDFLEHAFYDPVKRRAYYLKNRVLKGKRTRTIDRSGPVFEQGKGVVRPRPQSDARIAAAEKKIQRTRIAARKLPPAKRNAVLRKLNKLEKKLKKSKLNPFASVTETRKMRYANGTATTKFENRLGKYNPFASEVTTRRYSDGSTVKTKYEHKLDLIGKEISRVSGPQLHKRTKNERDRAKVLAERKKKRK